MADADIVETACARAWSVYLLINKGVAENDARRAAWNASSASAGKRAAMKPSFWSSRASNISRSWTGPPTTSPEPGMFLRRNRG